MKDDRKRYNCKCPVCSTEFQACKSIFQESFGILDAGSGSCPKCGTFHNLTVDEKNGVMVVTPWEKYKEMINNPQ